METTGKPTAPAISPAGTIPPTISNKKVIPKVHILFLSFKPINILIKNNNTHIALGAKKLVLDVKVGTGALIKNYADAKRLSQIMIDIGKHNNMEVICILTNMDIPLGNNIGNSLEVEETIDILKNNKKGSLRDLCIELSSHMVGLGLNISYEEAKKKVLENLENGNAYNKFLEIIKKQKGNIELLPKSSNKYE